MSCSPEQRLQVIGPALVARSPEMQEIVRQVGKLAQSDAPVLILGETGTGKEVVARAIHGSENPRPFIVVDCSGIAPTLIESELFGHVRGAFTGALRDHKGLLHAAHGGTTFFDEIGELPIDVQPKLLRALQSKEIRPIGSLFPYRVSFRVIAATHRDLAREMEYGRFRQDLFYRLNVVALRLAPLRERPADVPALVSQFLSRYGNRYSLGPGVLNAILSYNWPGNVRELENCIERLIAMASGAELSWDDLPPTVRGETTDAGATAPPAGVLTIKEAEIRAVMRALEHTRGDFSRAARLLGIGRTTLYRKVKQHRSSCVAFCSAPIC